MKVSNLFFEDIYRKATRKISTIFAKENLGIYTAAAGKTKELMQSNLATYLGNAIHEYEFDVDIISIETLTQDTYEKFNTKNYSIKHVGYYIIREEKTVSGDSIFSDPDVIFTDKRVITYYDEKIKYAGYYVYNIRSIYEIIAPLYNPNNEESIISYERFLMTSEGKNTAVSCIENIPPMPPSGVKGGIDYQYKVPKITWQFPVNPQRDIVKFQIFKREDLNSPYMLLAEYDFDKTIDPVTSLEKAQSKNLYKLDVPKLIFVDYNHKNNKTAIYSLASVDAHGMTSKLSTQISIKYNKSLNKPEVTLISREGAPKEYPNVFIEKDTFIDSIQLSNFDRMTLFFDPEYYKLKKEISTNNGSKTEEDMNLLSLGQNTYNIQIVNIDLAKSKEINISIYDKSSEDIENIFKAADFNPSSLSFRK